MKVKEPANQNTSDNQAFWKNLKETVGKTGPYLYDETSTACRLRRLLENHLKSPTTPKEEPKQSPEKQLKRLEQRLSKLKQKMSCAGWYRT